MFLVKASLDAAICETKQIIPGVIEREVYSDLELKDLNKNRNQQFYHLVRG